MPFLSNRIRSFLRRLIEDQTIEQKRPQIEIIVVNVDGLWSPQNVKSTTES